MAVHPTRTMQIAILQVLQRMAFRELTNLATAQTMAKKLEDENSLSPPKTPLTWSLNAKT